MFLVLGNATIDESMTADTWPAPGQTVVVGSPRRDLGGKGANQAIVLSRTGAPVRFVAAVGRDAEGAWVERMLQVTGLSTGGLIRVDQPTDRSLIFVNPAGENAIASTTGAATSITPETARACVASLQPGDGLVLQGNLTLAATRAALSAARAMGVRTVLNPSPLQAGFAGLLGLVDLLVLNEGEAFDLGGAGEPRAVASSLQRRGCGAVVLTLGDRGAIFADLDGSDHVSAEPVSAVDTTGAGDTFAGVLAGAFFHHGSSLRRAVEAGSLAAALTVQREGTVSAFPSAQTIAAILRR